MSEAWNPAQYQRFQRERAQPFFDLLALVEPRPALRAVDLGCGTGELTLRLHETLRARQTLGLDSSASMLAKAPRADGLQFQQAAIESFASPEREATAHASAGTFDLAFSNAALHWVADHPRLLRGLRARLAEDGQLAVQMPYADDDVPHAAARELARTHRFREKLQGYAGRAPLLTPSQYAAWLHDLGFVRQHVRVQIYAHLLDDRSQVVEWVRGALLTDYEKRLSPADFADFLARYRALLLPQLSDAQPYLYLQPRLLFWGSLA